MKKKAIVFAPLPPPVGGVASIVSMLNLGFNDNSSVLFKSPYNKSKYKNEYLRSILNSFLFLNAIFKINRDNTILVFASSGFSFYEKLIWARLATLFRRRVGIILVDGNFPTFFSNIYWSLKNIVIKSTANKKITFGVQSEMWYDYYKSIFPESNLNIVTATVDTKFQSRLYTSKISTKPVKLIYVGWVIPAKGIYDLLDSIEIIKNINNYQLEIVGPLFDKADYWNSELEKRGIKDKVVFSGEISDKTELINRLLESDIFIFPSHFEGFPVSVIEAISLGLPCIATNVGGIPDILENGNVGLLVEPRNPALLSNAILELVNNDELRAKFSKLSFDRSRLVYNQNNFIESYRKILNLK